jgi:para-nitrobenzyl esterase
MKPIALLFCFSLVTIVTSGQLASDGSLPTVKTADGILQGTQISGISIFKGVPFAQPPVGDLRWKAPQPVKNWEGTLKADHFSARPMQLPIFSDMNFRSPGISEDCLYLNIWTPAKNGDEQLPVLVFFYGGGMKAGDASEYRYDGESMARKGIVAVTVNYRLGVFGFLAHPELSQESAFHGSGDYGLMDQTEALRWLHKNVAAFGGNPDNITIAGESAGSSSVCAQIVSPLARNLFAGAIGESGSILKMNSVVKLKEAEQIGLAFSKTVAANSLKELRAMPAEQLLNATAKPAPDDFPLDIDGYFFPESPVTLYKTGRVAKVPVIIGWNSEESNWKSILKDAEPTKENYTNAVKKLYPTNTDEILKLYAVNSDSEVIVVATSLASDRTNAFGSWRWVDLHTKTNSSVYRYFFTKARPGLMADINKSPRKDASDDEAAVKNFEGLGFFQGAVHSAEIEYALGNLPSNRVYDWQASDYMVSTIMQDYFVNFIRTKNPNGTGLPYWPLYQSWQKDPIMFIGYDTHRAPDKTRERYMYFDKISGN